MEVCFPNAPVRTREVCVVTSLEDISMFTMNRTSEVILLETHYVICGRVVNPLDTHSVLWIGEVTPLD